MTPRPVDLPRVRRALETLDRLAAAGVRPMTCEDLEDLEPRRVPVKGSSVRLSPKQEAELDRLAEALTVLRPDLVALARGDALTAYTVLRLAIDRGLREIAADVERAQLAGTGGAP